MCFNDWKKGVKVFQTNIKKAFGKRICDIYIGSKKNKFNR